MPPFLSEYLSPTSLIAITIVRILQYSFLFWFIGLLILGILLLVRYIQIKKNQSVLTLVEALNKREDSDQILEPERIFNKFCTDNRIDNGYPVIKYIKAIFLNGYLDKGSSVTKHLKAIFLAGWNESRLEVGELINHTTSNLFRWNNLFRSVLAVFIVIGLLGTLFGLADSLVELSPALKANAETQTLTEEGEASATDEAAGENSRQITQALSHLMNDIEELLPRALRGYSLRY